MMAFITSSNAHSALHIYSQNGLFFGMMQIPEALVRYLASLSNSVKHHNKNERPYSTIKSSSSSMITINIKLGETTEPKK